MKHILVLCCLVLSAAVVKAQSEIKIKTIDSATQEPLAGTNIRMDGKMAGVTNTLGVAIISTLPGMHEITISAIGFKEKVLTLSAAAEIVSVPLIEDRTSLEEVTLVASTRNNQAIESSPMKVEVLGKEEVGEEVGIKPGNIASILGDVSGVQIQQSSAVTGNSNVRIQGLQGRYTQILRDGMPLYDGFAGGLGILTIPPLDLRQIELIKGSASTLYGGGAIAGLINLISRKPSFDQEADLVANYTTLSELNLNAYIAKRKKKMGYTLFAGYTTQQAKDVNDDGLSDVPESGSLLIHPKLFFFPSDKTIISIGYSGTFDQRKGGDMRVLDNKADNTHQYYEQNISQRHSGEYLIDHFFEGDSKLTVKGSVSYFDKSTTGSEYSLAAGQLSYYNELSVYKRYGSNALVAGINIVGDNYQVTDTSKALIQHYDNATVGAFAQYTLHLKEKTTLEGGLRTDYHNTYGAFVLPRAAVFHQVDEHFGVRAGFGMGYKIPNPLNQQDIEYNPLTIAPRSDNMKAEISYGYNVEGNYKKEWDKEHTLFINQAFFLTQINRPLFLSYKNADTTTLVNMSKPVVTMGFDTYVKLAVKSWELYGGYTYTDARNQWLNNSFVPLTPRHRLAFVVVKEIDEVWRFGVEGSYTGTQYRYDGSQTPSYMFLALMAQRKIGKHVYIVLNCENLLDYRMSKVESLYNGSITNPIFKPLWAPIDGRVVNLSIRWKL